MPGYPARIIVVGAGIVGRACALRLQQDGADVVLLDSGEREPASWGNAGHVAAEYITPFANPGVPPTVPRSLFPRGPVVLDWRHPVMLGRWFARYLYAAYRPRQVHAASVVLRDLMAQALPAWQELAAELGQPDLLDTTGTYKLWERPGPGMQASLRTDHGSVRACAVPEAERARLAGGLRVPVAGAVRFHGTAQVRDLRQVLDSVMEAFVRAGGTVMPGHALKIDTGGARPVVWTGQGPQEADQVLVACGIGSAALLHGHKVRVPLMAERGYHLEWDHGGAWTLSNIVFEDRNVVVTRFGARLRATSIAEFTQVDMPPNPARWAWLERHVTELGLPVASAFSRWSGFRPSLPDYLPALGPIPGMRGVFAAYGHQHLGLTLAAVTARLLTGQMRATAGAGRLPLPAVLRAGRFGG
ncbi:FAD-binding oxidoreductase [Komagataeibacter sp. FNDCF1]|uniref:NAD(P)/FAD-dependent oxidoreductase n=1 Tax=Komagataeibacter sp. FNDCF1 TaxID=2878681 RepID=UPI00210516E5|nr:FAD-dependent oxidoreductase [Komagataeibacter sp. FNDCF1]MCE2563324.1 FAD-dependent oxidoreductase [Komagataeibacter sp. FNDCF1]